MDLSKTCYVAESKISALRLAALFSQPYSTYIRGEQFSFVFRVSKILLSSIIVSQAYFSLANEISSNEILAKAISSVERTERN